MRTQGVQTTILGIVTAAVATGLSGCSSPSVLVASEKTPITRMQEPASAGRASLTRQDDNAFTAELPDFEAVAAREQDEKVWCWAACAEMVHAYHGKQIDQAEIAMRIHGAAQGATGEKREQIIRAGTLSEILRALVPDMPPQAIRDGEEAFLGVLSGKKVKLDGRGYMTSQIHRRTVNSDIMIDDLLAGEPLVVGLRFPPANAAGATAPADYQGHACVVYAAEFSLRSEASSRNALEELGSTTGGWLKKIGLKDGEASDWLKRVPMKYDIRSVSIMDPWTGKPAEIAAGDFAQRVDFMISAREARAILERESLVTTE